MVDLLAEVFGDAAREEAPPTAAPAPPPSDPAPVAPLDGDPLAVLGRALAQVERDLQLLPPTAIQQRRMVLSTLGQAASRMEAMLARRPRVLAPDAVHEAIRAEMDGAVANLLRPVAEAETKLRRDRAALLDGLDLGPALAAEIGRRVDAMLGAP